ncbi:MAG: HesA/MoeB/ThiF family protein [Gallionella sp.]
MELDDDALVRYARQILLPEVGEDGQQRLAAASVLIVGAGGLGVPVASYLAAAGVGRLGMADGDTVALSNLPRQVAYATADIGLSKVVWLAASLSENNPNVEVECYGYLTGDNVGEIIATYDLVADCCDNFPTRYLVNSACVRQGKPLVSAALSRYSGQLAVFVPGAGCYQCMVPDSPDNETVQGCVEGGILGPLAGLLGCWQAFEVLKQLMGLQPDMAGNMLLVDALDWRTQTIRIAKNVDCPVCGGGEVL